MARLVIFWCGRRYFRYLFWLNRFIWNNGDVMRIVIFDEEWLGQYDGVVATLAKASPCFR
ncbi:MAG: hypothetical protein COB71_03790 [Thiotrichales bacterium]|nr:MAG: hypothetical protein COB71_03790 [Thiotrichales bacterium]